MTLCLTPTELEDLTGRTRAAYQARALNAMGFTFKRRPDGSVAVDRQHYDQLMGVRVSVGTKAEWEPDLRQPALRREPKLRPG